MTRKYEQTHPWITFQLNLDKSDFQLWLLLGECKSKIEHIAGVPLHPDIANTLHHVYLAKGVHATTAIEGNTLSETQVKQAIDGNLHVMPSLEYQKQEVRNILKACNYIGARVFSGTDLHITPKLIKSFNKIVRHKLPPKSDCLCVSGEVSEHNVVVGNVYRGAPREDCEWLLGRLCEWLNGPEFQTDRIDPVILAVLKACVAHLYIAWIHPFCDGNGRSARLLELLILLNASIPSAASHLLSNHYNATRSEYYVQLANTSRSGGNILPFLMYAVSGLRDQLAEQITWIREQQIDNAWRRYIAEAFPSPAQPKHKRQRELVEALGKDALVPMKKLTSLNPEVARSYARLSPSTLSRDLIELQAIGLIDVNDMGEVRARREQILAFLPPRRQPKTTESVPETPARKRRGRPKGS